MTILSSFFFFWKTRARLKNMKILWGLESATLGVLLAQDIDLVQSVHLLQEDECEDAVGSEPEVEGRESPCSWPW